MLLHSRATSPSDAARRAVGTPYRMRHAYLEQCCRACSRFRAARPRPRCLSTRVPGCRIEGRASCVDTAVAAGESAAHREGKASSDGGPREARLDSSVEQSALGIAFAIEAACCPSIQCVVVAAFCEPLQLLLTRAGCSVVSSPFPLFRLRVRTRYCTTVLRWLLFATERGAAGGGEHRPTDTARRQGEVRDEGAIQVRLTRRPQGRGVKPRVRRRLPFPVLDRESNEMASLPKARLSSLRPADWHSEYRPQSLALQAADYRAPDYRAPDYRHDRQSEEQAINFATIENESTRGFEHPSVTRYYSPTLTTTYSCTPYSILIHDDASPPSEARSQRTRTVGQTWCGKTDDAAARTNE